jgi:hypothetical protein
MRFLLYTLLLLLGGGCVAQRSLDLSKPEDILKAQRKIQTSLRDGENCYYTWSGAVYGRTPQARDKLLFLFIGMSVRASVLVRDSVKGDGYRQVSREVLIYLDPETKQILHSWANPWTGKTVEVVQVTNDPVNTRPTFAHKDAISDFRVLDSTLYWDVQIPLWYPNVLGGDYQQYVGGMYQAIEMFNFIASKSAVTASGDQLEEVQIAWTRVCPWLPWMEMGDWQGQIMFNGTGKKVRSFEQIPETLREFVRKEHPLFMTAPPLDDKRPNETSWSFIKKLLDTKKQKK